MTVIATPPFPSYFDVDGSPLDNGYIYYGVANQNPETNPITVYWDAAYSQPAAQPIRTSGGFAMRNGTPAAVYVNADYSVTVRDKNKRTVYSKLFSDWQVNPNLDAADIPYSPSGAGAIATNVQDKLREIVSVKDYGAKGDGLTDDTASIQAALNYIVTNGGGTLFLPPGTYNVTSLSLNNNGSQAPIYIRGCGPRSTVIKKTGTSLAALLTLQTTLNVLETYHEISDLTLWGNNGASNHNGLSLTNYALFVFKRVQIRECYACFYGEGALVGSIYDCTFKDSQFGVILRKSSDNVYSNDLNFHGCIFAGASQWAADISQGSGIRFTGCDFESNGQTGVSNTGALMMRGGLSDEFGWSQVSVFGCWFESNKGTTISSEASAVNVRMSFRDSFVASSDSLSAINLQGAHTVEIDGLLATSPSTTVTLAAAISAVTLRNSTITTLVNNCANTTQTNVTTSGGLTRFKTESSAGSYIIDTVGHKFTGPVLVNNAPNLANHTIAADGATENALVCLNTDTGASSQSFVIWRRGSGSGVVTGSISNTSTSTAYNTSSDYRLKDDPAPLTGSGEFIDALQPKVWKWKVDGSPGVGFIAHEVQAVSSSSVTGAKDAIDEHGNPEYQTMEYGSAEFVANIVAELQALRKRVFDLESMICKQNI